MFRKTLIGAMLVSTLVLSGCTLQPVYSDGSPINAMSLAFDLGTPKNRLEQIIYQDIALRFAISSAPKTPKLTVSAHSTSRVSALTPSGGRQSGGQLVGIEPYQVTVTATATAVYEGKQIFTATRSATAGYTQSNNVLASKAAQEEATERATQSAAESLRLAILATFPTSIL